MVTRIQIVFVAVVLLATSGACVTPQERQARQVQEHTYEMSLQRQVQGYVYEMRCAALLPMAQELLWEEGFDDVNYVGQDTSTGLRTGWVESDDVRRSRYQVHAHQVGDDRCAVQFLQHEEVGDSEHQRRDPGWELSFLEYVNDVEADRVRDQARQDALDAYRESLKKQQSR